MQRTRDKEKSSVLLGRVNSSEVKVDHIVPVIPLDSDGERIGGMEYGSDEVALRLLRGGRAMSRQAAVQLELQFPSLAPVKSEAKQSLNYCTKFFCCFSLS